MGLLMSYKWFILTNKSAFKVKYFMIQQGWKQLQTNSSPFIQNNSSPKQKEKENPGMLCPRLNSSSDMAWYQRGGATENWEDIPYTAASLTLFKFQSQEFRYKPETGGGKDVRGTEVAEPC